MGKISDFFRKIFGKKEEQKLLGNGNYRGYNDGNTVGTQSYAGPSYSEPRNVTQKQYEEVYGYTPGNAHVLFRKNPNSTNIEQAGVSTQKPVTSEQIPEHNDAEKWRDDLRVDITSTYEGNIREGDAVISQILQRCGAQRELAENPIVLENVFSILSKKYDWFATKDMQNNETRYSSEILKDQNRQEALKDQIIRANGATSNGPGQWISFNKDTGVLTITTRKYAGSRDVVDEGLMEIFLDSNGLLDVREKKSNVYYTYHPDRVDEIKCLVDEKHSLYNGDGVMQEYRIKEYAEDVNTHESRKVFEAECRRDSKSSSPLLGIFRIKQRFAYRYNEVCDKSAFHTRPETEGMDWYFAINPTDGIELPSYQDIIRRVESRTGNQGYGIPHTHFESARDDVDKKLDETVKILKSIRCSNPRQRRKFESFSKSVDNYRGQDGKSI